MRGMRVIGAVALAAVAGCTREPAPREYELTGQILAVDTARREVLIRHEDIKGFMPGMTMPFKVQEPSLLRERQPGDLVRATLVVGEVEAHLSTLAKTGSAPLPEDLDVAVTDGAILKPGDNLPDQTLVDQDGRMRRLASFSGHRVALTFTYLRCPVPDFCPLMDKHFAEIQKAIKVRPELADVRLVTATFDPEFDTPAALKEHARAVSADPQIWTFLTGTTEDALTLAGRFGVLVEREDAKAIEITHNLRTAVIGADGRVSNIRGGNDWTPAELIADLEAAPAPAR